MLDPRPTEGALVQLENGHWAQYRRLPVKGIAGMSVLVAVELDEADRKPPEPVLH